MERSLARGRCRGSNTRGCKNVELIVAEKFKFGVQNVKLRLDRNPKREAFEVWFRDFPSFQKGTEDITEEWKMTREKLRREWKVRCKGVDTVEKI